MRKREEGRGEEGRENQLRTRDDVSGKCFCNSKRFPLDGDGICTKLTTARHVACNIQMQHKNAESCVTRKRKEEGDGREEQKSRGKGFGTVMGAKGNEGGEEGEEKWKRRGREDQLVDGEEGAERERKLSGKGKAKTEA